MRDNYERFRTVLPAAGTFSKDPRVFWGDEQLDPAFLVQGKGCYVVDSTGKEYIDWICALGAMILGYDFAGFNTTLFDQIQHGCSFSLPTTLEYRTAEKLVNVLGKHVPSWRPEDLQVRFTKTGTECTTAAVRLARAVTGRDLLLRCSDSYLGWGDWSIATTPPALGIPHSYKYDTWLFKFGQDPETFIDDEFDFIGERPKPAAVILEQGLTNPPDGWYDKLRKWCNDQGALLILDETASGFRYGLGGAAEWFGIQPDLATYGKALGNGVAISALVGNRDYMSWFAKQSPVFVSGTFCGETLGLAAANFVLSVLSEFAIGRLAETGQALIDGLRVAFSGTPYQIVGHAPRFIIQWPSDEHHAFFVREMAKRDVLANRPFYTTLMHTKSDVTKTVYAAYEVVDLLKTVDVANLYKPEQLPVVLFRNR